MQTGGIKMNQELETADYSDSREEPLRELQIGLEDMKQGRTKPFHEAMQETRERRKKNQP